MTFEDSRSAIFLPESEAGHSPCNSQAGAPIVPSGRDLVPVSRSARRESKKPATTKDISGRRCTDSSKNAGRKSYSASKSHPQRLSDLSLRLISLSRFKGVSLHEQTNSQNDSLQANLLMQLPDGLMEYAATWKRQITPCGFAYWEHSASAHRTSEADYSGWPTPEASNEKARMSNPGIVMRRISRKQQIGLEGASYLTPWVSPTATDGCRGSLPARLTDTGIPLSQQVALTPWVTPSTRDHKDSPEMSISGINPDGSDRTRIDQLPRQAHGVSTTSSTALTVNRGVLNAGFSKWMMGFPQVWDECSPNWFEFLKTRS